MIRPNRSVWPTIGVDPVPSYPPAAMGPPVAYAPAHARADPSRDLLLGRPGADRALVPEHRKSAEARLRYYAERYDTVEVNSSYYAIPEAATATSWAERTPDGFVFHVKAFGMMTGHRVRPEQLPADLRPLVRSHVARQRRPVTRRCSSACSGVSGRRSTRSRAADKLGGVLMQYGPGFAPSDAARRSSSAAPSCSRRTRYSSSSASATG